MAIIIMIINSVYTGNNSSVDIKLLERLYFMVENINITKNDEVVVKKQLKIFKSVIADIDEMFTVKDILENSICITNGNTTITVDNDTFKEHFEKYIESVNDLPVEYSMSDDLIAEIMEDSEIIVDTVFDRCTVVSCKLPNGFVIVESSTCVDPENYDIDMGIEICLDRIASKVWELEGYRIQHNMYEDCIQKEV